MVEHLPSFSEAQLEEHEEHAELSLWMMTVSGLLSLMSILAYKFAPQRLKITRILALIVTLFAFVSMIPLANYGGKIMHQELRGDAPQMMHEDHD